MKKIVFLMLHLQHGGVEKQTITLINHLVEHYEVEIKVVYKLAAKPAYDLDERTKISYLTNVKPNRKEFKHAIQTRNIFSILKEGFKSASVLYKKRQAMVKAIKNLSCDIVFSTRTEYANYLTKFCSNAILKVTQEHNHIEDEKYGEKIARYFTGIDHLIVMSQLSYDIYAKWLSANQRIQIDIIPNILEEIPKNSTSLGNNAIISAGRFHPVKDYPSLLRMFAILHEKKKDIKLILLGDGEERPQLETLVTEYHLEEFVELPGMLDSNQVNEYFMHADLFIMTSFHESFSLVILEANACGLPVISFAIPAGPNALVLNGETGYLIEDRNIEKMADTIASLYENKEVMLKMGNESRKYAENYLPENVLPLWYDVFENKK